MRVIRWLSDISLRSLVSGLNASTVVYVCCARGVSGNRRPDIARGDHTHLACLLLPCVTFHSLLFVYFPVNNGVLYFLDSVEEIYTMVLSVLVSILNP